MDVSRHHFYDIKTAYEEGDFEGLKKQNRCTSNLKNRVRQEVEPGLWASPGLQ